MFGSFISSHLNTFFSVNEPETDLWIGIMPFVLMKALKHIAQSVPASLLWKSCLVHWSLFQRNSVSQFPQFLLTWKWVSSILSSNKQ